MTIILLLSQVLKVSACEVITGRHYGQVVDDTKILVNDIHNHVPGY